MSAPFRLPAGGRVDRDRPLRFTFDGREYDGLRGDTLASALLDVIDYLEPRRMDRQLRRLGRHQIRPGL